MALTTANFVYFVSTEKWTAVAGRKTKNVSGFQSDFSIEINR